MLSWVEHEKSFITSGLICPALKVKYSERHKGRKDKQRRRNNIYSLNFFIKFFDIKNPSFILHISVFSSYKMYALPLDVLGTQRGAGPEFLSFSTGEHVSLTGVQYLDILQSWFLKSVLVTAYKIKLIE